MPLRSEPVAGRVPAALLLAAAGVGGFSVILVELSAVRLLAPWFGTSQVVWTNVIGVVLLALAVGYLLGARWACGARPELRLARLLVAGSLLVLPLPFVAPPLARFLVPLRLPLEDALPLVGWGSLAASLALFLVPAALLGAAGPLAVEALARRSGSHAGTAGGQVLAASTLASLAGAFVTSHVALPHLGVAGTFASAALGLFSAGAMLWASATRRIGAALGAWLAAVLLCTGSFFAPGRFQGSLPDGWALLDWAESPYQRVMVVEDQSGSEPLRYLQVNEGLDSFQSVWRPTPGLLGEGYYYDDFALPAYWAALEGRPGGPWRTAVLGLGAGTVWRVLEGAVPSGFEIRGVGAELDPVVVELGRRWMDLPPSGHPHFRTLPGVDGRFALRVLDEPVDLVVVDAYANQHQLPPHLVTTEFFAEVRAALAEGGFAALNLGAFGLDDPLVAALAGTMAHGFGGPVLALAVPSARNVSLFARRGAPLPALDPNGVAALGAKHGPVGMALASRLQKALVPGGHRVFRADGPPAFTDGRTPVEPLERRSVDHGRALREAL